MIDIHDLVIVQSSFSVNRGDKDENEIIHVPRHTVGLVVENGRPAIIVAYPGIGKCASPIANVFPIGKGDPETFYGSRVMECLECDGMFPAIYFDFDNARCCKCGRRQNAVELRGDLESAQRRITNDNR